MSDGIFRLYINLDNAAFDPNPQEEIIRILRQIAADIERRKADIRWFQTIFDVNGNDVGRYAIKPTDYETKIGSPA